MNRLSLGLMPSTRVLPLLLLLTSVFLASVCFAAARGWLGVSVQDITQELGEAMGLATDSGALISDVVPDGPADQAGLRTRDVIVQLDEVRIENAEDLVETLIDHQAGERVLLTVLRGGEKLTSEATLREPQTDSDDRWSDDLEALPDKIRSLPLLDRIIGPQLGVEVYRLDSPDLARYFQTKPGHGVVVLRVIPESPAERAGIRPGDVLLRFNDATVSSAEELRKEVHRLDRGDGWSIDGLRDGGQTRWSGEIERDSRPRREVLQRRDLLQELRPEEQPVWTRRQTQRLEREIDELRERIRDLERRLDSMKQR